MESYIKVIHAKYEELMKEFPGLQIEYDKVISVHDRPTIIEVENQKKEDIVVSNEKINKCEIEGECLNFLCPHCGYFTQVLLAELNCRIFRHGCFVRKNEKGEVVELLQQIGPHETEETCNNLRSNPNISGCCKPFQIVGDQSGYSVQVCGYI